MKCKYEGSGVWACRCVGTKEVDPCKGYEKCESYCPDYQTNADRIREMSDEELNEMFHEIYNAGEEDAVAYEWGQRTNSFEWTMDWLQQSAEEG